jgi:ABC-type branched-subunit amino acid transport system substrate-binding protein
MQKSLARIGIVTLMAVVLIILSMVSGCGQGAQTAPSPAPVTTAAPTPAPAPEPPKEIKIGMMGGQTGPAAASVVLMFNELEYVMRYINEVEGGIDGIKLNWKIIDNKGTPEGAVLAYKELKAAYDPLFYFIIEDYYYLGIKDTIAEDKAVTLTSSAIDARCYVPPSVFYSLSLPLSDGLASYINWVINDWKDEGKPKIGLLYWELASGQQYKMVLPWAGGQDVELVPVQFPMALMDIKPQLLKLQEANVDYIWMMCTAPQAAVAVRDSRALGIVPGVTFCFNEYVEPDTLLELAGEASDGFYVYRSESPYSDNAPAGQLYTKIIQHATGKEKKSDTRLVMTYKALVTALVKQAVADVGYDNLSREAIMSAMDKLNDVDTQGNTANLSFGPDRRIGITAVKMGQMTKTGRVSVGDWIEMPRIFEGKVK